MCHHKHEILSNEDAEIMAENLKEWEAKQPEYIAVEMTNEEIVRDLHMTLGVEFRTDVYFVNRELLHITNYRVINGKLYKKVKNPKIMGKEVISW